MAVRFWNTLAILLLFLLSLTALTLLAPDPAAGQDNATFNLTLTPGTLSIAQGSSGTVTINVTSIRGFSGIVTLSITGATPQGVFLNFNPSQVAVPLGGSASASLTIKVALNATRGSYTINLAGASSALSQTIAVQLTVTQAVPSFSIASSPTQISVNQGSKSLAVLTVTSQGGFNSPVTLSGLWLGPSPTGVMPALVSPVTPPVGSSVNSTLTFSAGQSASIGNFSFRVNGTSGSISRSIDLKVQIRAAAEFVIAYPAQLSVPQGGSERTTIIIQSLGAFASVVMLSTSSPPNGIIVQFDPNPVSPPPGGVTSATLTVTSAPSVPAGTYTLNVTGTSGSMQFSLPLRIEVFKVEIRVVTSVQEVFAVPPSFRFRTYAEQLLALLGIIAVASAIASGVTYALCRTGPTPPQPPLTPLQEVLSPVELLDSLLTDGIIDEREYLAKRALIESGRTGKHRSESNLTALGTPQEDTREKLESLQRLLEEGLIDSEKFGQLSKKLKR